MTCEPCKQCNDSGIRPSTKYFMMMEVCSCNQVERIPGNGLRIDMTKTPEWFQRGIEMFYSPDDEDLGEEV